MQHRMKHFLLSLFIIGLVSVGTRTLLAQVEEKGGILYPESSGGFLIGPIGGINLVSYKTNVFAILNSEPSCFTAQNGSDVAPFFGLTAEIPLGETMQNFIIIEGIYDSKSSKFTTANNTRADIPTKLNGVVVNGSITTSETATLNYLLVNAGYKYNFTTGPSPVGPGVQGCISVGIPLSPKLNKTVSVSASSGVASSPVSQNTQTSAVAVNGSEPGVTASLRIALRAQFTYDIPLTGNGSWTFTPTVGYDFPFTKVDNGAENWSASSAFGGVILRYFIGK
jgi:hypothetical protein